MDSVVCPVYKDESVSLKSLLMKTAEKIDQDYWVNPGGIHLGLIRFNLYIFRTI